MQTPCRPRIEAAGYRGRTERILARERAHWDDAAAEVAGDQGEPIDELASEVTVEAIVEHLAEDDMAAPFAGFLAGRCDPVDHRLGDAARRFVAGLPEARTDLEAWPLVESAMSLVLLDDKETGFGVLRSVASRAIRTQEAHLAAFYLAQLDDPTYWPVFVDVLDNGNAHVRLMAARRAYGFLPYAGQLIDGVMIDVRGALERRLDDAEEIVRREIPGILAALDERQEPGVPFS